MATTAGSLIVKIGAEIKDFEKNLSKADRMLVQTANSMSQSGQKLTLGITAPLLAAGAAFAKLAADDEAAMKKLERTFGAGSTQMNRFIGGLRNSVVATTGELQLLTAQTQTLTTAMGLAPAKAMAMTQAVTKLAGDLAAYSNVELAAAQGDLEEALAGKTRGLAKYGIIVEQAEVKTRAYQMGLAKVGAELTQAQRAQAAWSLIMERTQRQQGEAARTYNDDANAVARLRVEAEEAAGAFGQALAPALAKVARFMANGARAMSELGDGTKGVIITIAGVAAAIGPLTWAVGGMIAGFVKAKAVIVALTGVLGMAGLAGTVATGGILLVGLAALGALIWKSGEEARRASRQLDIYRGSLGKLTTVEAVAAEKQRLAGKYRGLNSELAPLLQQRDAIPANAVTRIANPNAPGTFIETPARARLDREIARIEAEKRKLADRMRAVDEQYRFVTQMTGGRDLDLGLTGDTGDKPTARPLTGYLHAPFEWGLQGGINAAGVRTALGRMMGMSPAIPLNANGLAPLGAGTVDLSQEFEEMRQKYEIASRSMGDHIVAELKNVPSAIAGSLAQFLGPVLARWGAGAATGGMIGSAVGGAIGTGIGKKMGGTLGSMMGPLGGIAGTFLGGAIGAGIGKLFGKPKDKTEEAAKAMERLAVTTERVNAALTNLPAGYKIDSARFRADVPDAPNDDPDRDRDDAGDPVTRGGGGGGSTPTGPNPGKDDVARARAGGGLVFDFTGSQIVLPAVTDPESFLDQLVVAAERRAARGGMSPLLTFT